jgi:rsbT co-antagonist protein RsbR
VLLAPIVGHFDEQRANQLTNVLLAGIQQRRARVLVLDVTGATPETAEVVPKLRDTIMAARLLGAKVIMTGISSELASALLRAGAPLPHLATFSSLRDGLASAQAFLDGSRHSGPSTE